MNSLGTWFRSGPRHAVPLMLYLLVGFVAPLAAVVAYSFMPERTYSLWQAPTLQNYVTIFESSSYLSFLWSLGLASVTVIILALVCYPVALGLSRVFGRWSMLMSLVFTIPLFVSENVRLYGWILFFIKNGLLLGTLKSYFGVEPESVLFTQGIIVFGMVYVYLPFMLFPMTLGVSMVPTATREAAFDLGASRWQVFKEVDLPLSMPGIMIGLLLTFVLAVGAIAEAKVLGGQKVIPVTHDIEIAFTYAQNWPLGAAMSVLLMLVVGTLVLLVLRKFDLDAILGSVEMMGREQRLRNALIWGWSLAVAVFLYLPGVCLLLASLTSSRYFIFPITKWGLDWWGKTLDSIQIHELFKTSIAIAICVTILSVTIALFGALAFARYEWKGRSIYQRLVLLPIFFPQSVLGLALLLWFNAMGMDLSWKSAVFAHLVWIAPVATLVIAIQVYSFDPALEEAAYDLGASRWQVFREVTLPVLFPGIFSGALFSFLLSWGNFPLSLFTTGADTTIPEYLYAKMVAGYTPGVPVLGTISTVSAAVLLLGGYAIIVLRRRRQML